VENPEHSAAMQHLIRQGAILHSSHEGLDDSGWERFDALAICARFRFEQHWG
jgi:hypothetical protein